MAGVRICSIDGCGKPIAGRGWCRRHYDRWSRHGDPLAGGPPKRRPERLCDIDGCNQLHHAHGYCADHANRLKAHGDPLAGGPVKTRHGEPQRWIRDHADFEGPDCLIWPFGATSQTLVRVDGRNYSAQRYMCILAHGAPPSPGLHAAHSCGHGHLGCVHPKHLRWATAVENEADKLIHGTRRMGEDVHLAKLTEPDVLEIRRLRGRMTQVEIASLFNITQVTVSDIHIRKTWKHLP